MSMCVFMYFVSVCKMCVQCANLWNQFILPLFSVAVVSGVYLLCSFRFSWVDIIVCLANGSDLPQVHLIEKHPRGTDVWWESSKEDLLPPQYRDRASEYVTSILNWHVFFLSFFILPD